MSFFVLLIEDNLDLSETIIQYLELEDIICDYASSAESGLSLTENNRYDVILLDIMLPRMTGLELCKMLRKTGIDTPVLMLTARDTLDDKLEGFESGTDDYLVKPFDLPELVVRIKALAKRKSGQSKLLKINDLTMHLDVMDVSRGNRSIQLSPISWKLLEVLMRESPKPVSRQKLIQFVWGDAPPESNSLKVHLHRLRKQIDGKQDTPLLQTIPNQGYALRVTEPPNKQDQHK